MLWLWLLTACATGSGDPGVDLAMRVVIAVDAGATVERAARAEGLTGGELDTLLLDIAADTERAGLYAAAFKEYRER